MTMTDPIADMLTRIRNAPARAVAPTVEVPPRASCAQVVEVLKREGFIEDFRAVEAERRAPRLRIYLKYGPDGEHVINAIERVSTPGRRVYRGVDELPARPERPRHRHPLHDHGRPLRPRGAAPRGSAARVLCKVW